MRPLGSIARNTSPTTRPTTGASGDVFAPQPLLHDYDAFSISGQFLMPDQSRRPSCTIPLSQKRDSYGVSRGSRHPRYGDAVEDRQSALRRLGSLDSTI